MQTPRADLSMLALLAGVLACTESGMAPLPTLDPELLTPAVAAQLDDAGRFPRQVPEAGYVSTRSEREARALIGPLLDRWFASQRHVWEATHGAAIDRDELTVCGRVYYASSPYIVSQMTSVQPLRWRAVGRYSFTLCGARRQPQLWVTVPVEPNLLSDDQTDDIIASGIPVELDAGGVISPEQAVRIAAGRTGRRVASVPELVIARFGQSFTPRWLIQLESPVIVQGQRTLERDTLAFVLVGFDSPESQDLRPYALRPLFPAAQGAIDSLDLSENPLDHFRVRPGFPRSVEPFFRPYPLEDLGYPRQ